MEAWYSLPTDLDSYLADFAGSAFSDLWPVIAAVAGLTVIFGLLRLFTRA